MKRSMSVLSSGAPRLTSSAAVWLLPARTARRSADMPRSSSWASGSAPAARRAATTSAEASAAASGSASVASRAAWPLARSMASSRTRHRVGVVGKYGGADRPGSGHHRGAVGEQQLQAAVVAEAGRLADGPALVGVGSRLEQDPGDIGVVQLHRPLQGGAVSLSGAVVGVRAGPGVEQEPDHLGHPRRSARVDLVPAGVAGVQQRRPASNLVDGDRGRRVDGQPLAHLFGVAEDGGGLQAVAGDVRDGVEDAGGLAHTALDRRRHERPRPGVRERWRGRRRPP